MRYLSADNAFQVKHLDKSALMIYIRYLARTRHPVHIGYKITSDIGNLGKQYPPFYTHLLHKLSTPSAKASHFLKDFTCDIMHLST